MSPFRSALIGATLLTAASGVALAQTPPPPPPAGQVLPTYDPAQLPAIKGKVAQYTLTPRGDIDGLILDDGTQVQIPPPYSTQVVFAIRPGDTVTVHGLKARALPLVSAMSITNDASNVTVTLAGFGGRGMGPQGGPHMGPGGPRESEQALEATGKVKAQLHGPRGELNGVLLDDGTVVHLPPPEAERLAASLAVGQAIYVSGNGAALPYGRVIGARMIGATKADAKEIAGPRPGMHGWMHGMAHWGHGPGPRGDGPHGGPRGDGPPPPPPAQ
jgi:hypothetical protein